MPTLISIFILIVTMATPGFADEPSVLPQHLQKQQSRLIRRLNKEALKSKTTIHKLTTDSKIKKSDQLKLKEIETKFDELISISNDN